MCGLGVYCTVTKKNVDNQKNIPIYIYVFAITLETIGHIIPGFYKAITTMY